VGAGLVIFDCDGVLVDSERIANRILAELATAAGIPTTFDESVANYLGHSLPECVAALESRLGRALPGNFADAYYERLFDAFDRELRQVEGLGPSLAEIDAGGYETCVASSGAHERVARALERTGLAPRFAGRTFSADEVEHGKPAPDLFLHAAQSLGWDPASCVVVEDSPAGVEAGVAAGMRVLGYADLVPAASLAARGATVFSEMAVLGALVTGR
jgi:beta-phosphoglucomutase-like phosphatase (HAD superfamily)